MAEYKKTKSASNRGCNDDGPVIFPGGGDCGPGNGACVGPDCPDPWAGCTGPNCPEPPWSDPCLGVNPPADCNPTGGWEEDGCNEITQECTGPDCKQVSGQGVCTGPNCLYIGGQYHVYRVCRWGCEGNEHNYCNSSAESCPSTDYGTPTKNVGVLLPFYDMAAPAGTPYHQRGKYMNWISSEEHFRMSEQELGRSITHGEAFYPARLGAFPPAYEKIHTWIADTPYTYPLTHTLHEFVNDVASDIPHPWNFTGHSYYNEDYLYSTGFNNNISNQSPTSWFHGTAQRTWRMGTWQDFSGKTDPWPQFSPSTAMVPKGVLDQIFIYQGKTHCSPHAYFAAYPWAVSQPGVITTNNSQLFDTGGTLLQYSGHYNNNNRVSMNFPVAYDLTNSATIVTEPDSGLETYEGCGVPDSDIAGYIVDEGYGYYNFISMFSSKAPFLMPGAGKDYVGQWHTGSGFGYLQWPRDVGTNDCACVTRCDDDDPVDCMDPLACNFNSETSIHDPSACCYVTGCRDSGAFNYNADACCSGECCYIEGCTDAAATNTDAEACFDDGSCCYISGCTDPLDTLNYNPLACDDDGSCTPLEDGGYAYGLWCEHFTLPNGYTETQNYAFPLKPGMLSPGAAASYGYGAWGCTDQVTLMDQPQAGTEIKDTSGTNKLLQPGDTISPDVNPNQACTTYIGTIESATDLVSSNQLIIAAGQTIQIPTGGGEHGPCPEYQVSSGYTIIGDSFDGSCSTCCDKIGDPTCGGLPGCNEPLAANYNPTATNVDNDTCEWWVPRYCASQVADDYHGRGGMTMGRVGGGGGGTLMENFYLYGDQNSTTQPDFTTGTLADNIEQLQGYLANLPGTAGGPLVVFQVQMNGTRLCFVWLGWDVYVGDGSIPFNDTDGYAGGPTLAIEGPYGSGSTTSTNIQSGSVSIISEACGACGGVNTAEPSGCTDSAATNYDPFATIDDGSCDYGEIYGCMEASSLVYDMNATIEDGSCKWEICCCEGEDCTSGCLTYNYNAGYLIGQTDINTGLAIPLDQDMIDYNTLYSGAITAHDESSDYCQDCKGEQYLNSEGVDKVEIANIVNAANHSNASVQAFFGASDIILDFGYPVATILVPFPNTDELNANNGIPGNPAYPPIGFDPEVKVVDSLGNTVYAVLDPVIGGDVLEYSSLSGVNLGKAFKLNGWTSINGASVASTVRIKGTGCVYGYNFIDNSSCPQLCIELKLSYETKTSLRLQITGTSNYISVQTQVGTGAATTVTADTSDTVNYSATLETDYITNDKIIQCGAVGVNVTVTVTELCSGQSLVVTGTTSNDPNPYGSSNSPTCS